MITTPDDIIFIISGLATFSSSLLRDDQLPPMKNAILAGAAFVMIVVTYILLTTGFAGTMQGNVQYVVGGIAAVAAVNQVRLLFGYIEALPSPLVPKPTPPSAPVTVRATAAYWNRETGTSSTSTPDTSAK